MSTTIKTILISGIPLPFTGIGSWTTSINYLIKRGGSIDYIVCPHGNIKTKYPKQYWIKNDNSIFTRLKVKFKIQSRFKPYIQQFEKILKNEEKVIVQIVDNLGLLFALNKYVDNKKLRNSVYIQYFFHGFNLNLQEQKLKQFDELILLSNEAYLNFKKSNVSSPIKVNILPNGVNSAKFYKVSLVEKVKLRQELNIESEKKIFVWCSQDHKKKGLDIIIQAWMQFSKNRNDVELLVIGVNKDICLPNVNIIGRIPNNELAKYYQLSDVFLFSTLCQEGFGLVLAEALKCGCYCIASSYGSVPEVLNYGKYGRLINRPHMVSDWVDNMRKALKDLDVNDGNHFSKQVPDKLYEMEDWFNNYEHIIAGAKENFNLRYYI